MRFAANEVRSYSGLTGISTLFCILPDSTKLLLIPYADKPVMFDPAGECGIARIVNYDYLHGFAFYCGLYLGYNLDNPALPACLRISDNPAQAIF